MHFCICLYVVWLLNLRCVLRFGIKLVLWPVVWATRQGTDFNDHFVEDLPSGAAHSHCRMAFNILLRTLLLPPGRLTFLLFAHICVTGRYTPYNGVQSVSWWLFVDRDRFGFLCCRIPLRYYVDGWFYTPRCILRSWWITVLFICYTDVAVERQTGGQSVAGVGILVEILPRWGHTPGPVRAECRVFGETFQADQLPGPLRVGRNCRREAVCDLCDGVPAVAHQKIICW